MASPHPIRLVICVDGTWFTPDGKKGKNITNVYRICASIKRGMCVDPTSGETFEQQKEYYPGLGTDDHVGGIAKLSAGVRGTGYRDYIRNVYERCAALPTHPKNDIWFFGFSRGAYIVRAVAGLLHDLRALTAAGSPQFEKEFDQSLQIYKMMRSEDKPEHRGRIHSYLATNTTDAAKIKFVGVIDTVKAVPDKELYDLSFNDTIHHFRHALSFNEDRKGYLPSIVDANHSADPSRTMIQAWFLGTHSDVGGAGENDGLALYPLQWMLLEARAKGLVLEFDGSFSGRASIDDPLNLVFPQDEVHGKGIGEVSFNLENGLTVPMHDLRYVHTLENHRRRYAVQFKQKKWTIKEEREPFGKDGSLLGSSKSADQGTIIHPSVYFIFDVYSHAFLNCKNLHFRNEIMSWRPNWSPVEGFWGDGEIDSIQDPGAIRILVCGNSGIGKSTLINEVFGTNLTVASDRSRGVHNIKEPIQSADRPDLIVHDSGGFETGGEAELQCVKEFIIEMSSAPNIKDRLHVIWFCIEINSSRTQQASAVALFSALSDKSEIPVIIVGTKKDDFWDKEYGRARKQFTRDEDKERHADSQLAERMKLIEEEISAIEGGRFDRVVAVSNDDAESIKKLTEDTAQCITVDRIRMLYVAAQHNHINLKVDLAIVESQKVYRQIVRSATMAAYAPGGSTGYRRSIPSTACKVMINIFGVRCMDAKSLKEIMQKGVWHYLRRDQMYNSKLFLAEALSLAGIGATAAVDGIPVFLATGAINASMIVPATATFFLLLAADLILILTRACKMCLDKPDKQPTQNDIEAAIIAYASLTKKVHTKIKTLTPPKKFVKTYQYDKIELGFRAILDKYLKKFVDPVGKGAKLSVAGSEANKLPESDEDDDVTLVGSEMSDDLERMRSRLSSIDTKDDSKEAQSSVSSMASKVSLIDAQKASLSSK